MLTFKLSRRGKTKQPTYRLLVLDKRKDPWGKFKEDVGSYNPHTKKAQFKAERIKYWLNCGAQPSATVHNLLVREKILEAPKKKIKIKKKAAAVPPSGTMASQETASVSTSADLASVAEATSAKEAATADKKATEDKEKSSTAETQKTASAEVPKTPEAQNPPEKAETPKTEAPKEENKAS